MPDIGQINLCPVHCIIDWTQDHIDYALAEMRQYGLAMHSLRRTAAVIVRVYTREILGRDPSSSEMLRLAKIFGWCKKTAKAMFNQYAKDYEKYSLKDLPLVWSGLMTLVLGQDLR